MTLETFAKLVADSEFSVLITDAEINWPGPRIVYANKTFERITGYSLNEVLGKTPRILQGEKTDRNSLDSVRAALEGDGVIKSWTTTNYRKDGSTFVMHWTVEPITLSGVKHFLAIQTDATNGLQDALEEIKRIQIHTLAQMM
jgi:PAS domain S-box-containing protein